MNKSKFIATLIVAILILLNVLNIPYKVEAAENLGTNLYENEGFEKSTLMKPFVPSVAKEFTVCSIDELIGVDGSRGLKLVSKPNRIFTIENYFDTKAGKSYRAWLTGKNGTESTENILVMGIINYEDYSNSIESNQEEVYFNTYDYETKYIDFTVGDNDTKAKVYISVGKTEENHTGSAIVDDFVLEETTSRPTIDEILNPLTTTAITGTANPGAKVEVTLPDGTVEETTAGSDGKYSITIEEGSLEYEQAVSVVQYGLYGIKSSAAIAATSPQAPKLLGKNLYANPGFELNSKLDPFDYVSKSAFDLTESKINAGIGVGGSKGYEMLGRAYSQGGGYAIALHYYYPTDTYHSYRISLTAKNGESAKSDTSFGVRHYNSADTSVGEKETFTSQDFETKRINFLVEPYEGSTGKVRVYILAGDAKTSDSNDDLRGHAIIDDFIFEKAAYPPTINSITNARHETSITGTSEPGHKVTIEVTRNGESILKDTVTAFKYSGGYSLSFPKGTLRHGDTITAIQHGLAVDPDEEDNPDAERIMSHPATFIAEDNIPPDPPEVIVVRDTDKDIKGVADPGSTVTITFENGDSLETIANSDSTFSIDLDDRSLNVGEIVSITAKFIDDKPSDATKKTVLDTSKNTINEDDDIGIYAKNFVIELSEVNNLSDDKVFQESEAKLFKLSNEATLDISELSVNKSSIENEVGIYPVELSFENTNRTIYAFVVKEPYKLDKAKDILITATNFSINSSAALGLTNSDILSRSDAKAWRLSTKEEITEIAVNKGSLEEFIGDYIVTLTVDEVTVPITVSVVDAPEITDIRVIGPEGYTNGDWAKEDVTLEITAISGIGINHSTYLVSYDEGLNWERGDFTDIGDNKTTLIINKEGRHRIILIKVSDFAGETTEPGWIDEVNIDRTPPYCTNYENNAYYDFANIERVDATDKGSGIHSMILNGKSILPSMEFPKQGINTLVITDKAGNTSKITFTVLLYTEVKIKGNMIKDSNIVETIERGTRENSLLVTPETTVILKNSTNDKEYIGILAYDDTLIFKEIDYGNYEVYLINPSDILSTKIDIPNFELSGSNKSEEIILESKHVTLNGFGNILENNTL